MKNIIATLIILHNIESLLRLQRLSVFLQNTDKVLRSDIESLLTLSAKTKNHPLRWFPVIQDSKLAPTYSSPCGVPSAMESLTAVRK